jgi:tripartite-type tricarboxylate transporter receptor subunit TctC
LLVLAGAAVTALSASPPLGAQAPDKFPSKPIRLVIPFPPGGTTDIIGRAVGARLTELLGQPLVFDNRPGAAGTIGSELVARAPADGYTLVMSNVASHATAATLYAKLPYDPVKDFAPITLAVLVPQVLLVHPSLPARNVKELIAIARKRPGEINFGSSGTGSTGHLGMELLKSITGTDMVHIPYKGAAPAMLDLLGGRIVAMIDSAPTALPQVKAGKVRAIGTTGPRRMALLPDIPTVAEQGFPGFETVAWFGFSAPAGTPAAVIARLHQDLVRVLKLPEVREQFAQLGAEPVGNTPAEYLAFQQAEIAKWAKVIRAAGVRLD